MSCNRHVSRDADGHTGHRHTNRNAQAFAGWKVSRLESVHRHEYPLRSLPGAARAVACVWSSVEGQREGRAARGGRGTAESEGSVRVYERRSSACMVTTRSLPPVRCNFVDVCARRARARPAGNAMRERVRVRDANYKKTESEASCTARSHARAARQRRRGGTQWQPRAAQCRAAAGGL